MQLLDEVSRVTTTTWVTRRPPEFRAGPFTEERGRAAVALVEERVRRGLPPRSVVSVTGLPVTPAIEAMRARGVLERLPMFSEIFEDGVRWPDGTALRADVILWCTGFRSSLDHLAPLMLREPGGGITMTGKLATQVAKRPEGPPGRLRPLRLHHRREPRRQGRGKGADGVSRRGEGVTWLRTSVATN